MQHDAEAETLRDDLGLELEGLLAIEPSPELGARVRERVAADRVARWWPLGWQLARAVPVLAVLAIVLVVVRSSEQVTIPLPVVPPSNAPAISVPVVALDTALSLNLAVRPREIALSQTRPAARSDRVSAPRYPVLALSPLEPLTEISIEPVAIEPLGAIAPLSGEHQ
jgi:hypothetical protein